MILLYHDTGTHAHIATPARLGRELHPPRHYQAEGHFLALDGPSHVIAIDAEDICKIPGWRLATPQEQNAYHASKRGASAIHEDMSVSVMGAGDELPVVEVDSGDSEGTTENEPSTPGSVETEQASNTTAPTRGSKRRK